MSEHIVDAMITKVYKGPSGESEHGPWQVYNIYLNKGDDKKFGYMQSGNKPIPVVGMGAKHIEYEIEKTEVNGKKYTNYKVKKLELVEDEATSEPSKNRVSTVQATMQVSGDRNISFWVAYTKDLMVEIIRSNPEKHEGRKKLHELAKNCAEAILIIMDTIGNRIPSEKSSEAPQSEKSNEPTQEPIQESQKKTWPTRKIFIADVKSYEERLGLDVYADILSQHEINPDELSKLDPKKGGALYDALEEAYQWAKETE